MCNYQLLSSSRYGFIKRCDSCKKVKFTFGTLSATMYSDHIDEMRISLIEQKMKLKYQNLPSNAIYELPLDEKVSINMNRTELEDLYELIVTASNMADVYQILEVEAEG